MLLQQPITFRWNHLIFRRPLNSKCIWTSLQFTKGCDCELIDYRMPSVIFPPGSACPSQHVFILLTILVLLLNASSSVGHDEKNIKSQCLIDRGWLCRKCTHGWRKRSLCYVVLLSGRPTSVISESSHDSELFPPAQPATDYKAVAVQLGASTGAHTLCSGFLTYLLRGKGCEGPTGTAALRAWGFATALLFKVGRGGTFTVEKNEKGEWIVVWNLSWRLAPPDIESRAGGQSSSACFENATVPQMKWMQRRKNDLEMAMPAVLKEDKLCSRTPCAFKVFCVNARWMVKVTCLSWWDALYAKCLEARKISRIVALNLSWEILAGMSRQM